MSKEERYTYHCDQYDYVEIIYDNEECEEIDSMKMAEKRLNRQQDKISDLEAKLIEKDKAIENWQTMYESVVQTCYNDKEEIERLNKRLETQENTITNLVEDNRASQEWYKKQLEESESRFQAHKQTDARIIQDQTDLIENLKQQLAEKDELIGTLKNKYECTDRELYLTKDTLKHHTNIYNSLVESRHQDKISFALEQLEKVKEMVKPYLRFDWNLYLQVCENIDNQIKQLKEIK